MRYLVTARVKPGRLDALDTAIDEGTLGRGSIAGDEYLHNMAQARQLPDGRVKWVETCFCETPLEEERPYWEAFFELLSVKDAHARTRCRHETGQEYWACSGCDCTERLERVLEKAGQPFRLSLAEHASHVEAELRLVARAKDADRDSRAAPLAPEEGLRRPGDE
jgi:hypothetical protein